MYDNRQLADNAVVEGLHCRPLPNFILNHTKSATISILALYKNSHINGEATMRWKGDKL